MSVVEVVRQQRNLSLGIDGNSPRWDVPGKAHVGKHHDDCLSGGFHGFLSSTVDEFPRGEATEKVYTIGHGRKHYEKQATSFLQPTRNQREPSLQHSAPSNPIYFRNHDMTRNDTLYRRHLRKIEPPINGERTESIKSVAPHPPGRARNDRRGHIEGPPTCMVTPGFTLVDEKQAKPWGHMARLGRPPAKEGGEHSDIPGVPDVDLLPEKRGRYQYCTTSFTEERFFPSEYGRRKKVDFAKTFSYKYHGTAKRIEDVHPRHFKKEIDNPTYRRFLTTLKPVGKTTAAERRAAKEAEAERAELQRERDLVLALSDWEAAGEGEGEEEGGEEQEKK